MARQANLKTIAICVNRFISGDPFTLTVIDDVLRHPKAFKWTHTYPVRPGRHVSAFSVSSDDYYLFTEQWSLCIGNHSLRHWPIPKDEIEAASSLGVSKWPIFKDILMPMDLRSSYPSLINELITLVKESSIVSLIGLLDLMRRQQIVTAQTFLYFEPLLIVGIIYYTLVKTISFIGRSVERRWLYAYRT